MSAEAPRFANLDLVTALDFFFDEAFHGDFLVIGLFQHGWSRIVPTDSGGEMRLSVFGTKKKDLQRVSHFDSELPVLSVSSSRDKIPSLFPVNCGKMQSFEIDKT
jgi:hypothetical protein